MSTSEVVGRARLLLVDDEPSIVDAGTLMLEAEGYVVASASDSKRAMRLLAKGFVPDLLICDYRLPGMNGIELVGRVRSYLTHSLPVLIMTGDTTLSEAQVKDLAHSEWLRKPFEPEELLARVAYWLQ